VLSSPAAHANPTQWIVAASARITLSLLQVCVSHVAVTAQHSASSSVAQFKPAQYSPEESGFFIMLSPEQEYSEAEHICFSSQQASASAASQTLPMQWMESRLAASPPNFST
jgi:hypothetical protein